MSDYSNLIIIDNYSATSADGIVEYENTIEVDVIPTHAETDANGKKYFFPVTLDNGTDIVNTVATGWTGTTLTLEYSAPAGGFAGPVSVICAPNSFVHKAITQNLLDMDEDGYSLSHYPIIGEHNHIYAGSYTGNDHTVYLPTPVASTELTNINQHVAHAPKISMLIRFDSSAQSVAFDVPAGYTLQWADASAPALSSGRTKLLIDFQYSKAVNASLILGTWRAFA